VEKYLDVCEGAMFFRRLPDGDLRIIHIAAVCRMDGHVGETGGPPS